MKKRVIIIGNSHPSSIENMFYNSFKKNKIKVSLFDPNKYLIKLINNKIVKKFFKSLYFYSYNSLIYKYLKLNKNSNIVFFFKNESLNKNFLKKIKKSFKNNIYINYNTDNPFFKNTDLNKQIKSCIGLYDYYFTWSNNVKNKIIKKKITY